MITVGGILVISDQRIDRWTKGDARLIGGLRER